MLNEYLKIFFFIIAGILFSLLLYTIARRLRKSLSGRDSEKTQARRITTFFTGNYIYLITAVIIIPAAFLLFIWTSALEAGETELFIELAVFTGLIILALISGFKGSTLPAATYKDEESDND